MRHTIGSPVIVEFRDIKLALILDFVEISKSPRKPSHFSGWLIINGVQSDLYGDFRISGRVSIRRSYRSVVLKSDMTERRKLQIEFRRARIEAMKKDQEEDEE